MDQFAGIFFIMYPMKGLLIAMMSTHLGPIHSFFYRYSLEPILPSPFAPR
uniref:Uncharacterized protein n=1 Tax=Arion vulgaris TaxID=1028688 RepID=A0A0B7AYR3_9EUPU